jgi:hypothetical protein
MKKDKGEDAYGQFSDGTTFSVACSACDKRHLRAKVLADCKEIKKNRSVNPPVVVFFLSPCEVSGQLKDTLEAEVRALGFRLEVRDREWFLEWGTSNGHWPRVRRELRLPGQGYTVVSPYNRAYIEHLLHYNPLPVPGAPLTRPELERFRWDGKSLLVLGKPGAGKTTTLVQLLDQRNPGTVVVIERAFNEQGLHELTEEDFEADVCVLCDDVQARPQLFRDACYQLEGRLKTKLIVLAASRAADWHACVGEIGNGALEAAGLRARSLQLLDLSPEMCEAFLLHCARAFEITIPGGLRTKAVEILTRGDATPLYVVSVLAPIQGSDRPDRTLRLTDITGLPETVTDIWLRYFEQLASTSDGQDERNFLRALKMVLLIFEDAPFGLPEAAAGFIFHLQGHDLQNALERLGRRLWLRKSNDALRLYDTQREAIEVRDQDWESWNEFVHRASHPGDWQFTLRFESGKYFAWTRAAEVETGERLEKTLEAARDHFASARQSLDRSRAPQHFANCLGSEAVCLSELARLAKDRERARALIQQALDLTLEAALIQRRENDLRNLATSLNNASNRYSEQAAAAEALDERRQLLAKAVAAIEEAINIRRKLALPADLASSLNNASNRYSERADEEVDADRKRQHLKRACAAIDEAISLLIAVGQTQRLLTALPNGVQRHLEAAELTQETTHLAKALEYADRTVDLFMRFGRREEAIPFVKLLLHWFGIFVKEKPSPDLQSRMAELGRILNAE